jgi:hypothetical protein
LARQVGQKRSFLRGFLTADYTDHTDKRIRPDHPVFILQSVPSVVKNLRKDERVWQIAVQRKNHRKPPPKPGRVPLKSSRVNFQILNDHFSIASWQSVAKVRAAQKRPNAPSARSFD